MKENEDPKFSRRKFLAASTLLVIACALNQSDVFAPAADKSTEMTDIPQSKPTDDLLKERRSPVLGIRNDIAALMEQLPGASFVRIAGDRDRFETVPNIKEAIYKASINHLNIYYTDNPQKPISVPEIERKVDSVIDYAAGNITVIGSTNEVDDVFWEGDFATVAPFILVQSDYIFRKYEGIQVAIGGLANPERMSELIYHLKNPNYMLLPGFDLLSQEKQAYIKSISFNPVRYIYTFHAYFGPSSVVEAIAVLKNSLAKEGILDPVIWGEEIGIKDDKSAITHMLDVAIKNGAKKVIVHELPNIEGYGYMNPVEGRAENWVPNEGYFGLFDWSQAHLT